MRDDDLTAVLDLARQRLSIQSGRAGDGPLVRTLLESYGEREWVPATALAMKAKAFDDGVVAALGRLLEAGWEGTPGRLAILDHLVEACARDWPASRVAAEVVGAAWCVARRPDSGPEPLRELFATAISAARADPQTWVPLGVQARQTYRRSRLLARPLASDDADRLAAALRASPELLGAYERHLRLRARLAGAPSAPSLRSEGPGERCIYPPARDPLNALVENHAPSQQAYVASLVDRLADAVASGSASLDPGPDGGWYGQQLHALAPLLHPERTPEAERLVVDADYADHLRGLFAALYGQARETHVADLGLVAGAKFVRQVRVHPHLTFEPLAEHYRRRADGYAVLQTALVELLPEQTLASLQRQPGRREPSLPSLLDELSAITSLFRGAHAVVREELGFDTPEDASPSDREAARAWASSHRQDPDLGRDARCMVPLEVDPIRALVRVQLCVGFRTCHVLLGFDEPPAASLRRADGSEPSPEEVRMTWSAVGQSAVRPVVIERWIEPDLLMSRATFQDVCDGYQPELLIDEVIAAGAPSAG